MSVTFLRAVDTVVNKTEVTSALRELTFYWRRMINQFDKLVNQVISDCGSCYEETNRMIR